MRQRVVGNPERLELRRCLAAVGFEGHVIADVDTNLPTDLKLSDLDADGDMDVVTSSQLDGKVGWYENLGQARFGAHRVISDQADGARSVATADIDGDGDVDVISTSIYDNKLAWYENLDGLGSFGDQQVIARGLESMRPWFQTVATADIDIDGDLDVVVELFDGRGSVQWYENLDGAGQFGPAKPVSTNDRERMDSFHLADLDADGDPDVISGFGVGATSTRVVWYENHGDDTFSRAQTINNGGVRNLTSFFTFDADGDGDLDVLSSSSRDNKVAWYENSGNGTFGRQHVITSTLDLAAAVWAGDADGDGDLDVFAGATRDIRWYENTDGAGTFELSQVITTRGSNVSALGTADLDGDGDLELLSASWINNKVAWYDNTDGLGNFGEPVLLDQNHLFFPTSVMSADMDRDDDADLITADWEGNLLWVENVSNSEFGPRHIIGQESLVAEGMAVADVDTDGDTDVITGSRSGDVAWYENLYPADGFTRHRVATIGQVAVVHATDVDGDGDADIVSGGRNDRLLAWFENLDGRGAYGPLNRIPATQLSFMSLDSADFDSDGDIDILSVGGKAIWHENTDGNGDFAIQHPLLPGGTGSSVAVDFDRDGDIDVVSASGQGLLWSVNEGGTFSPPVQLTAGSFGVVTVGDFNLDGQWDVAAGAFHDANVILMESIARGPVFDSRRVIARLVQRGPIELLASDLNDDGRVDLAIAAGDLIWHENRVMGDANRDGRFDQLDLVKVFQAGTYEDAIRDNSTFDQGDWNNDGDFTSADLVAAFKSGNYVGAALRVREMVAAIDVVFADDDRRGRKQAFMA